MTHEAAEEEIAHPAAKRAIAGGRARPCTLRRDERVRQGAFKPLSAAEVQDLLARTAQAASAGKFERFKSSDYFDSTAKHPHWLEDAKI